jgi:hypothetical protein
MMTQSIFDPGGEQTERSGSRNLGPDAANISHVPPDVVDGKVEDETGGESDNRDLEQIAEVAHDRPRQKAGGLESPQ